MNLATKRISCCYLISSGFPIKELRSAEDSCLEVSDDVSTNGSSQAESKPKHCTSNA